MRPNSQRNAAAASNVAATLAIHSPANQSSRCVRVGDAVGTRDSPQ
jgi:hypothetical protein